MAYFEIKVEATLVVEANDETAALENVEYSLGDVVKSFSIVEVGVAE
jgi:hypothetical protein